MKYFFLLLLTLRFSPHAAAQMFVDTTFKVQTSKGNISTPGTPQNGTYLNRTCSLSADALDCSFATGDAPQKWGNYECPQYSVCFVVAAYNSNGVKFTLSNELLQQVQLQNVKTQVLQKSPGQPTCTAQGCLTIFEFAIFPQKQFLQPYNLKVFFETVPFTERRFVNLYYGSPPYNIQFSQVTGSFTPITSLSTAPFQSLRVRIRVSHHSFYDNVTIGGPGLISGQSLSLYLNGTRGNFSWLTPTMCVGGIQTDGSCPNGLWERQFGFKPQFSNYTLTFGQLKYPEGIFSRYFSQTPFNSTTTKDFLVITNLKLSSFVDSILRPNDPQFNDEIRDAFINCPMSTMYLHAVTVGLINTNTTTVGTNLKADPVEIKKSGNGVEGALYSPLPQPISISASQLDSSNKVIDQRGTQVQFYQMKVDWTPRKGQEGYTYDFCFNITNPATLFSNIRCLRVKVVRCQYCTQPADTLLNVATKYHTNWLQLWSANSESVYPSDQPSQYPLDLSNLQSATRITLGPTYITKVFDDLPGIASRFQTTVDRLLEVNPDIHAKVQAPVDRTGAPILPPLLVGQEVCVIPPICPRPP
uniref:LysM domain-containing protein n=1 Tax=Hanusia phi TaxID=3032 RepID=A0A7S0I0F2_9CRYP|mmetsp:Transcript_7447/g.16965  ORF Transcript_7447/g.16965 Transcript_7447/m.16965 type:complete len:584 (+) Transcript_7447:117-1868(+)